MLSSDAVDTSTTPDYVSPLYHYYHVCGTFYHPYSSPHVSFDLGANTDLQYTR